MSDMQIPFAHPLIPMIGRRDTARTIVILIIRSHHQPFKVFGAWLTRTLLYSVRKAEMDSETLCSAFSGVSQDPARRFAARLLVACVPTVSCTASPISMCRPWPAALTSPTASFWKNRKCCRRAGYYSRHAGGPKRRMHIFFPKTCSQACQCIRRQHFLEKVLGHAEELPHWLKGKRVVCSEHPLTGPL